MPGTNPGAMLDGAGAAPDDPPAPPDRAATLLTDLSPEARRRAAAQWRPGQGVVRRELAPGGATHARMRAIVRRVWNGVLNDGFIHAGNFAYMVLVSLIPFFITGAALFRLVGEDSERNAAVHTVLRTLPPMVAATVEPAALAAISARSGTLLWLGAMVGLWTVGSLVETVRDVLRRAYGTGWERAFWHRRLVNTALILAAVALMLLLILTQVAIGAAQELLAAAAPRLNLWMVGLWAGRVPTALGLFGALWSLFVALTPAAYRARRFPKWPGALFVCLWWLAVAIALPRLLAHVFTYDLTYGSLAGVMIALFFFWLVGLGMVIGAELNAALAETP